MVPPIRNEAPLSDPDRSRPAVPDPQQDRHVSFPDDASPQGPTTFGSALPPEAWAPRPSRRESSSAAPRTRHPHTVPARAPSILTTPPVRPEPRRRRPSWLGLLLVPPLLLGISNVRDDGSTTDGCTSYTGAGPGTSDCSSFDGTGDGGNGVAPADSAPGVWAKDVTGAAEPLAPLLEGSPKVSPVPADATLLRVEVVSTTDSSAAPVQTQIDTSAEDFLIDAWDQGTPHAIDIHLEERPTSVEVSVNVTSGRGRVQCRIYAGSTLVAIDTSTATATCSPAL